MQSAAAELAQQGHAMEEPMVHGLVDAYGHDQQAQADMSQLGMDGTGGFSCFFLSNLCLQLCMGAWMHCSWL